MNDTSNSSQPVQSTSAGCAQQILFFITVLWVLLTSFFAQFGQWLVEQMVFEGSLGISDIRWGIQLGYAVLLFAPAILLSILVNHPRIKKIYQTLAFASILSALLIPARLVGITDFQMVCAIQLIGITAFLLIIWIFNRKRQASGISLREGAGTKIFLALLAPAAILIPWARWGSLGSPLDLLLSALVGLLFGVASGILLEQFYLSTRRPEDFYRGRDYWLDGFVSSLVLLVLSTALGINGNEWLISVILPALGWICPVLFIYKRHHLVEENAESRYLPVKIWPALSVLIGLTAALILAFVDPDELMIVTAMETGDLFTWTSRILAVSLLTIFLAVFVFFFLRRRLETSTNLSILVKVLPGVLFLLAAAFFVFLGKPGFYGERLFVILKDQADVSSYVTIPDYNQRREKVYSELVKHADLTQKDLRSSLDRWGISYKPYYLVNGLEVNGGPLVRLWLQNRPDVDRVLSNPILRPLPAAVPSSSGSDSAPQAPEWNLTSIGADKVWKMGITGKGIIIGQSDSGVQGDHPELADSYRGRDGQDDYNWFDPWNHSRKPTDIGGHGTHTLGSILGNQVGVAPDAEWIGCVNLARNLGNPAYYLDCWQFMLAPFPQNGNPFLDGEPARGAMVLNNSWGCPEVEGCDPNTFLPAVRALRAAGIFVVVSTGNSGEKGCGSVSDPPSIYQEVLSVGAVNSSGDLASFSSLGPVTVDGSQRTKPDISAPGEEVLSSFPNNTYSSASGTSMAGPHLVGVVALLWSANPQLIGDIDLTTAILEETVRPYQGTLPGCSPSSTVPNNASGYGIVDAYNAVQKALLAGNQ